MKQVEAAIAMHEERDARQMADAELLTRTTGAAMEIDLNADLGEGRSSDEALLDLVSSANIAHCHWLARRAARPHMRDCVRWAVAPARGVSIGAIRASTIPENFGHPRRWTCPPREIYAGVLYQLGALSAIAQAEGGRIAHEAARRAYNQAARSRPEIADAIVLGGA